MAFDNERQPESHGAESEGDEHRAGQEEPPPGASEGGADQPDPDVEGPTPDSERKRLEGEDPN